MHQTDLATEARPTGRRRRRMATGAAGLATLAVAAAGCWYPPGSPPTPTTTTTPAPASLVLVVDLPDGPVACDHPAGIDSVCQWGPVTVTVANPGDVPTGGPVTVTNSAAGISSTSSTCPAADPLGPGASCAVTYRHLHYSGTFVTDHVFAGVVGATDGTVSATPVPYTSATP